MAPPTPISCSKPDCDYTTPVGCPNWELMVKLLESHVTSAHPAPVGTVGAPRTSHNAKLESLPRPKFTLDMTESQWQFTKMQWKAYIEQTPASETQKVEQLRAACDTNLLQRVYDSGSFDSLITTDLLLAKMKELSVKKVHKTIHMVHMWKMIQEPSEGV